MQTLTKYQEGINHMVAELCLQNPNLLSDRKSLLEASRKKLDESGYGYVKGKSRSKRLNPADDDSSIKREQKLTRNCICQGFRAARTN